MPDNYKDAAVRHFANALLLRENNQFDNAGHLVGFAAECAIKFKIKALQPKGDSPHGHLPDLVIAARKRLHSRTASNSMFMLLNNPVFSTWQVNRRYEDTGGTTPAEIDEWFRTTKRLLATAGIRITQ